MLKRITQVGGPVPKGVVLPKSVKMENSWIEFEEGSASIVFGRDVKLSNVRISVKKGGELVVGSLGELRGRIIVEEGSRLTIGNGLVCNSDVFFHVAEGGSITVGHDCLLANARFYNSDLHAIFSEETGDRVNPARDVVIGDRVWIATNALILKGTNLSPDSVVGAGAVVAGKFPPKVVIAGNPARVVRDGVVWSRTMIDRCSIAFGDDFSPSTFQAAALDFDNVSVIRMGLPYLAQWRKMDRSNYGVFYYLARSILLHHFRAAPADAVTINGETVSLETVLEMLNASYELSEKRNHVCGAYLRMVALMLGKADIADRIYDEIFPHWQHIKEARFNAPWTRERA
ncbi:acyltransferase [Paraburkholderia fungorum]|uniref:acyltransferase n=1 Tax=Paraburkholderia fungorum TaxID=134537 RepID=UPI0038B9C0BD